MNIDQYRAIKEAEKQEKAQGTEQPETVETSQEETTSTETKPEETKPEETHEETKPEQKEEVQKFTIDGIGEVTFDEMKNGYLRQQDYTKKTQDLSRKSKEAEEAMHYYNFIQQNPKIAEQLKQSVGLPQRLDPSQKKVIELEDKLYDMMLDREIDKLQNKYDDFEAHEVLQVAYDKKITNLEDAYQLVKSQKQQNNPTPQPDTEKMKKEMRDEILKELKEEQISTRSSIGTGGADQSPEASKPPISPGERKVIDNMFDGDEEEYRKWKNPKKG